MTLLQLKTIKDNCLKAPEELKRSPEPKGVEGPCPERAEGPIILKMDLNTLKSEFFKHMVGKPENTLKEYHRSADRLHTFMSHYNLKNLDEIHEPHLRLYQDYYHGKGYSDVTIHYDFKTLSRFCKILSSLGLLHINPFVQGLKLVRSPAQKNQKRYYSHDEAMRRFHTHMLKTYGGCTAKQYQSSIETFIRYLKGKDIRSICSVTRKEVLDYAEYLCNYRDHLGKCYTENTIGQKLQRLGCFYRFFYAEDIIAVNPAKGFNVTAFLKQKSLEARPRHSEAPKPQPFHSIVSEYKNYLHTRNYTARTISGSIHNLGVLLKWLSEERNIIKLDKIEKRDILDYTIWLNTYPGKNGTGWARSRIYAHMIAIRRFFRFLYYFDHIPKDPTASVELPKNEHGLPTTCVSDAQARRILDEAMNSTRTYAVRDWALMELLYSTGMRVSELCYLTVSDIDFETMYVRIRNAKGGKSFERVVPFGKMAAKAVQEYLAKLRPRFDKYEFKTLFLSERGRMLSKGTVLEIVKTYVQKAGIKDRITTHSWRVGCATGMLKEGVDIRYVQEQLGHTCLESTKFYTRLVPKDLKKMHAKYHPREKYYRMTQGVKGMDEPVVF